MKFTKILSVVLLALMLISTVSYSQDAIPSGTARFEALGYNPFIKDASIDINRNPAWSTVYRNYVFGDVGRNEVGSDQYQLSEQFIGANFSVSQKVALGLVLNKFEDNWDNFTADSLSTSFGVQKPVVPIKVLFGWQASPKLALGLAPYYSAWSSENQPNANDLLKRSSYVFGGTIGVLGKMDGGWIEGAADVKTHKYKYDRTVSSVNTVNENEGGLSLDVYTRAFFTVNKSYGINLVPYLNFGMYSWNQMQTPTPAGFNAEKYSYLKLNGGLGVNMPIFGQGLFAGGLSIGYHSFEDNAEAFNAKRTVSEFVLPQFNLGVEWPFAEWLTGRIGYSRSVSSVKNELVASGVTTYTKGTVVSNPDQTMTVGLGLQFGRFSLDGTVGERLFKNGLYIFTGNKNDMFGIISASYNFAK